MIVHLSFICMVHGFGIFSDPHLRPRGTALLWGVTLRCFGHSNSPSKVCSDGGVTNARCLRPPRWGGFHFLAGSQGCARVSLHPGLSPSKSCRSSAGNWVQHFLQQSGTQHTTDWTAADTEAAANGWAARGGLVM